MHWSSLSEFFSMGGYALYVWGAYGATLLVLFVEVVSLLSRKRTAGSMKSELDTRN